MLVDRSSGTISHHSIRDLPDLLPEKSRLVFNNTKVVPARLFGQRTETGGKWEGLFLSAMPDGCWTITGQTRGRLKTGETITIHKAGSLDQNSSQDTLLIRLEHRSDQGQWIVRPLSDQPALVLLQQFGTLPLPPYIGRKVADVEDQQRYQTVYASVPGAIAAPTAGLHFTEQLLQECEAREIYRSEVTLHVGIGTFRPVSSNKLSEHTMHSEWCEVSQQAADQIRQTKTSDGSIVAVGTTSVRTLEASVAENPIIQFWQGNTNLFIRPGYRFGVVDHLLTNFHLPGSTLIVLVAALAGYDLTMEAYRKAVEQQYRFYSYGDAMLIR